jgi:hypothetical protein
MQVSTLAFTVQLLRLPRCLLAIFKHDGGGRLCAERENLAALQGVQAPRAKWLSEEMVGSALLVAAAHLSQIAATEVSLPQRPQATGAHMRMGDPQS